MMGYLPGYYENSRVMSTLIDGQGQEVDRLRLALDGVLDQLFVDTATWGLARWEMEYGIPTDESKPVEQRRSVIRSKIRGIGTVTPSLIKSVAESYANGEVSITASYEDYTVMVTFVSTYGVPPNISDAQAAIRDVLPAHLDVRFVFRFYTYKELAASGKTYAQMNGVTYDRLYNGGLT